MKNMFIKFTGVFILAIIIISCFPDKAGKYYPEPASNPFFISHENQTVNIKVRYLSRIEPYRSHWDDEITELGGPPYSYKIENEWITIYFVAEGEKKKRGLEVAVKENNSDVPRSYNLILYAGYNRMEFTITQRGRK